MSAIRFLVPDAVDDALHPSGGNRYDRELTAALEALGRPVELQRVGHRTTLADALRAGSGATPVLIDGLLLETDRIEPRDAAVVPLLHMPPRSPAALRVLAEARAVITTSEWTRRALLEAVPLPASAVTVATPGVEAVRRVRTSPRGERLRCVGALLPAKGQHLLLAALGRLTDLRWGCDLVGARDLAPRYAEGLEAQVGRLGIGDRIHLTGPVAAEPLERLYEGADLVVHPALEEGYGMVLAEAIACGVPVLAFDVGGVREAVPAVDGRRPGVLVPPAEPGRLAVELRRWLTDAAHRRRLTAEARSRSGRTWAEAATAVAGALDGLLVERP
ncbi:MAG: glycosyltransferase family 4 protein [Amnibacterium sp.]